MIKIAHLNFSSYVALAPMAGITDLPFRKLCEEMGAGLAVSEMTHSNPSLRHSRKTKLRASFDQKLGVNSIQIVGSDPEFMADAAQFNQDKGAQLIDINMGCPAKKVLKKAAGSALLENEALVTKILQAVINASSVPVTLKLRTGPSPNNRNGVRIARIAEDCGISALAVHGRTRNCGFNGKAEYMTIAKIVEAVQIPVFANGDINSPEKANFVLSLTGASGVMLGRAVLGQPWLCGQVDRYIKNGVTTPPPEIATRIKIMERHIRNIHAFYGEYFGVKLARKHIGCYFREMALPNQFRKHFNTLSEASEQINMIKNLPRFTK